MITIIIILACVSIVELFLIILIWSKWNGEKKDKNILAEKLKANLSYKSDGSKAESSAKEAVEGIKEEENDKKKSDKYSAAVDIFNGD